MRKYKKQELCNCIKTLKEAHRKINSAAISLRNEILPQCQEMAIQVGTEIDNVAGEGTQAVSYLEEYCEEVYQAVISTAKGDWIQHQRNIERLLWQIEDSIKADIPNSPAEIVFLPYKASMWDALDSVYRAAVKAENCNVTVMPIPYYNISAKGEVLAVEYEGNQFPADIQITDFRKVDLAKLHPDVIFIHNPYDEWNRVTQVPREYFSSTLINQTEHLVYIPYFVTKGDTIKDDYCYMPAVRNAWRTFVQSDAVRDCYIKNGADPKKIVAMGSPKFDMVIQMQENPPAIPDAWKSALERRKVFLLNTHLNSIINEAEKTMDKLHQIFELFGERDDVALLWRPHPLSIQTAKSMNSQILGQYMQLIEEFKKLPNCVYDDTADLHRAIALSDAYIGHSSSLLTMYGITGKPIYIMNIKQDTNIQIPEKDKCLTFACGVLQENTIWAPDEKYNGLYKIDLFQNRAELVAHFEGEGILAEALYHRVIFYKEKLYLIPWKAKYIAVYHIKTGEMKYLIPDGKTLDGMYKFGEAIQYKQYLFLFPAYASEIVRIDMESDKMDYFTPELLKKLEKVTDVYATFLSGVGHENLAWIASRRDNCLLEFDMDQCNCDVFYMQKSKAELVDIASDGNKVYVLNIFGEVLLWDRARNEEQLIWKYEGDIVGAPFYRIVLVENSLWLLPGRECKVIKLDISKDYKEKEILFPEGYCAENIGMTKFYDYTQQDNKIVVFPGNMDILTEINCDLDTIEVKKIFVSSMERNYKKMAYLMHETGEIEKIGQYLYNESICPVECFINIVLEKRETYKTERKAAFKSMQINADGSCGEKLWQYIYDELKYI